MILALLACTSGDPLVAELVTSHARAHPTWQADDVYKLLHQSVLGPGHAVDDPAAAAEWLDREIRSLGLPMRGEPAVEPLAGPYVRVNLRPWLAEGGDAHALLGAFLFAAEAPAGTKAELERRLSAAVPLVGQAAEARFRELAAAGYPAMHHSEAYTLAHAPAYRVIRAVDLPE